MRQQSAATAFRARTRPRLAPGIARSVRRGDIRANGDSPIARTAKLSLVQTILIVKAVLLGSTLTPPRASAKIAPLGQQARTIWRLIFVLLVMQGDSPTFLVPQTVIPVHPEQQKESGLVFVSRVTRVFTQGPILGRFVMRVQQGRFHLQMEPSIALIVRRGRLRGRQDQGVATCALSENTAQDPDPLHASLVQRDRFQRMGQPATRARRVVSCRNWSFVLTVLSAHIRIVRSALRAFVGEHRM